MPRRGPRRKTHEQVGGHFDSASVCISGRIRRGRHWRERNVVHLRCEPGDGRPVCWGSSWWWKPSKGKLDMYMIRDITGPSVHRLHGKPSTSLVTSATSRFTFMLHSIYQPVFLRPPDFSSLCNLLGLLPCRRHIGLLRAFRTRLLSYAL